MDITESPVIYLLIFIGFLVIVYFIFKFNQGIIDKNTDKAKQDTNLQELADKMGLEFQYLGEDRKISANKNLIYDLGWRVFGIYKDIPIELVMASKVQHDDKFRIPYSYSYSYSMDRKITFTVKNPDNKAFHILPKNKNVVADNTGNQDFDEKLTYSGDKVVSRKQLEHFSNLGWMNLTLKGNQLVFHDNFYDQFQSMAGSLKMMSIVHPIWQTSASNLKINVDKVQEFIDSLIDLIKDSGIE